MLPDLKNALYHAVNQNVPEVRIAVAFSGGVDSTILAKICRDLGKEVILLTVGFPGSHDIEFARHISSKIRMQHKLLEIDHDHFREDLQQVQHTINCENISHIENCIAYFYICKLAKQNNLNIVVSANGCDELFCGYDEYRRKYSGGAGIMKLMDEKLANESALMTEIACVAGRFGIAIRQPFLSREFIEFAKAIPLAQKIKGPDDMIRKHILRQTAIAIGVPKDSALKPKKALQYGSSIHKYFKKTKVA